MGRRFSQINADENIKNLSNLRLSASYKSVNRLGVTFLFRNGSIKQQPSGDRPMAVVYP